MDPRDLIHRLLDGTLGPSEEAALRAAAARDPALAAELAAYEAIARGASGLPRPEAPEGLEERVVARVAAVTARGRGFATRLAAPRFVAEMSWASVAAVAMAAILAVAGAAVVGYRAGAGSAAAALGAAEPTLPREVVVRFSLVAPDARRVELAGDFNDWRPEASPLTRSPGGTWSLAVPLEHGRHQYMFVVDGARWLPDPSAAELVDDGFGGTNAVVDVL